MPRPRTKKTQEKALTALTREITRECPDISDVGAILGALSGDVKALESLKKECGSVEEFVKEAGTLANVALVAAATKAALGYVAEERTQEYKKMPVGYDTNSQPIMEDIETGEKIKQIHVKPSETMLKFLLSNRLPEYFSDTKKVEINKKSIEIKADTEAEIKRFAGKLLDAVAVDAEFE